MRLSRVIAPLLCACFALAASFVLAQTLYKWTDKEGRVHFSDKPPVGFKGEVTKIQADVQPDPAAPRVPPKPGAKPLAGDDEKETAPPGMAQQRRDLREQLAARLAAARQKVAVAKKALEEGEGAADDEKQYVRQEFERNARRPERTPPPRSNCMSTTTSDGKNVWNCPRPIPNEGYFERQKKLEEALRVAEEELAEAERAYRRGVD